MLPEKFVHVFITNELRGKVAINIYLKGAYLDREILKALRAYYFRELHVFQRFANPYSYHQELTRILRILDKAGYPVVVNSELMRDLASALFNDPFDIERVQKELNLSNLRVIG